MSRSWRLFLQDTLEACGKIRSYTKDVGFNAFVNNPMLYDAVLRNLEIIGEAVKKISKEIRYRYPEVEWHAIAGLRDILAHAYFALDDATLWDTVRNKVPELMDRVRLILEEEP